MALKIPETGLQLESSATTMESLPMQAFAISLSNSVIENMIECMQNGEDVQLSLGNTPSFLYGNNVHRIAQVPDLSNIDLYLTDPSESTISADRLPNPTMNIFMKPDRSRFANVKAIAATEKKKTDRVVPPNASGPRKPAGKGTDADIEKLQASIAQANAEKLGNSTLIVSTPIGAGSKRGGTVGTTKGSSKNKLLGSAKNAMASAMTRSVPSSPAMSGNGSPSLAPTLSASQQVAEKAKENRSVLVHELAVRERSFDELQEKWPGDSEAEFKTVLDKVADFNNDLQKYAMKKMYWKELDVFNYNYESTDDRQQAIDNAVKMYDRSRMDASEPAWQKLLPKEERGKGKCLSKLQATIAKGPIPVPVRTPRITIQDAEDSGGAGSGKNVEGELSGVDKKIKKIGGEPMARSSSQPLAAKKKVSEREAQAKRLLSTSKRPVPPKASTPKVSAPKVNKAGKVLSKEFVSDSESSSEEAPLSTTVPKSKAVKKEQKEQKDPGDKPKERVAPAPKPKAPRPAPRPAPPKEAIKPQVTARPQVVARPAVQKRPREDPVDDDSSSSSGTPLSKRFKPREIKALPPPRKQRPSDSSQNSSRSSTGVVGQGYVSRKNTSPVKSSPLASSPPTNASDLDQQAEELRRERERDHARDRSVTVNSSTSTSTSSSSINATRKRKADRDHPDRKEEQKRARLSQELLDKARQFKVFYQRYEELHNKMVQAERPSEEKLQNLKEMRDRLQTMKSEIYGAIPAER